MKRSRWLNGFLSFLVLFLFLAPPVFSQTTVKITELAADTDPTIDDLAIIVDMAGPTTKKTTLANLGKGILALQTVVENTATTFDVTLAQARMGTFFLNTNAATKTFVLPAAEAGMAVCIKQGQGVANILRVDTDGTDYIVMSTGARTSSAGDYYGATADAKNQICLAAFDATDWYVISEVGTWTEQ